jgi:putative phosphoribosyl transferase
MDHDPLHRTLHRFVDRMAAGRLLAQELLDEGLVPAHAGPTVVLALPRGGVPVAFEVARALNAPLDVLVVRKLGHPHQPELAMGAIAAGQAGVINPDIASDVPREQFDQVLRQEQRELDRREQRYRMGREPASLAGARVIIVDDGVATGATLGAAIAAVKRQSPASITVAVPVGPADTLARLQAQVDELVCLLTPQDFGAISLWYDQFEQVSDEVVTALMQEGSAWGKMSPDSRIPRDLARAFRPP